MNSFEIEVSLLFLFFFSWLRVSFNQESRFRVVPAGICCTSAQVGTEYGCFVPLQIPGRTGRFGKNTGYRPQNENRPVKCKPTVKKKKDTQIPTVASTFLVATPLHQSSSISFLSLVLLLLLHLSSRVAPLLTD